MSHITDARNAVSVAKKALRSAERKAKAADKAHTRAQEKVLKSRQLQAQWSYELNH
jgi:hypothetical protein